MNRPPVNILDRPLGGRGSRYVVVVVIDGEGRMIFVELWLHELSVVFEANGLLIVK